MKKSLIAFLIIPSTIYSAPIEIKSLKLKAPTNEMVDALPAKKFVRPSLKKQEDLSELDQVRQLDKSSTHEINKFLSRNTVGVWDFTNRFDVKTGTAIKAIMLNSIVSSNLESPILIETTEAYAGIPMGTKFSCGGATKNKRVLAVCNKLITESDEYEVDTILLNSDGTAGLLGKAYSGKEQYAVGAITAAALKSALDVSLDRVNTSFGTEAVSTTAKNKIKSGGIGALDEIVQMSSEEYKNQEPKISIDAGKKVLVYFNRRFKL